MIDNEIDDLPLALDFAAGQNKEFLPSDSSVAAKDGRRNHEVCQTGFILNGHKEHSFG